MLEELGPTFIKFGQMLSIRPDLIPLELCKELEKLQDKVPPFSNEKVEKQIFDEFKKPLNAIFNTFSSSPVAAASLAQVHLAELKTGEKVVVKVQRPGLKKIITADLNILSVLAQLMEKYIEETRLYNLPEIVNELKKALLKEIDFNTEARNIDKFRRNFKSDDSVYILKVFHDLSTKKVLTMEQIEGIKVSKVEEIEKAGLDRKQIAINGMDAILKQIFTYGFFHADPHPGNIFILKDKRIAFIDFGMVGRIDEETKIQLSNILTAVIRQDVPGIIDSFISMGTIDEVVSFKKLSLDLTDLVESYYEIPLKELKMDKVLPDILNVISENKIKIPSDLFLLSRALITIEGVGKKLYPDFDAVTRTKPFVTKLIRQKYSPKMIAREIRGLARELYRFTRILPKDLTLIFNKIKKGKLKIEFEHRGLENLIFEMDKVSNRIAFSVVIAALIIGSSIVIQVDKGPLLFDLPVLGLIGFLFAGAMALWLAIAILRSGKL
jgi:ubiquinone biosynthesis protein